MLSLVIEIVDKDYLDVIPTVTFKCTNFDHEPNDFGGVFVQNKQWFPLNIDLIARSFMSGDVNPRRYDGQCVCCDISGIPTRTYRLNMMLLDRLTLHFDQETVRSAKGSCRTVVTSVVFMKSDTIHSC